MQIVPDTNVLVSAALAPDGVCGALLAALDRSPLDVVVSTLLLEELDRVLQRPRLDVGAATRSAFLRHVSHLAVLVADPPPGAIALVEADPADDYLVRLLMAAPDRILVTGDPHLLGLADTYAVIDPSSLLDRLLAAENA
jgi:predicted nucleic acid-binding protein